MAQLQLSSRAALLIAYGGRRTLTRFSAAISAVIMQVGVHAFVATAVHMHYWRLFEQEGLELQRFASTGGQTCRSLRSKHTYESTYNRTEQPGVLWLWTLKLLAPAD